jgi:hypothetical protein
MAPERRQKGQHRMMQTAGFGALYRKKYLNLETYRKSGKGVRTPVWFAAAPMDTPGAVASKLIAARSKSPRATPEER